MFYGKVYRILICLVASVTSVPIQKETTQANSKRASPSAAIVLIGSELLSGRTQDINLAFMAKALATRGIRLNQARIIPDDESVIIDTLNTLRTSNTYVFTTGGIGPTHDDITADCVARAFQVGIGIHPEAQARLLEFWSQRGIEPNEDRLRMARIPHGGELIDNPVSVAPGFRVENVYVLAGVPRIMQAMFNSILPDLQCGSIIDSVSVKCDLGEGTIAAPLRALQSRFPEVDLGSYPGGKENAFLTLVARSDDQVQLSEVQGALRELVEGAGGTVLD